MGGGEIFAKISLHFAFQTLGRAQLDGYLLFTPCPCLLTCQGLLSSYHHGWDHFRSRVGLNRLSEIETEGKNQAGYYRDPMSKCFIWLGKGLSAFQISKMSVSLQVAKKIEELNIKLVKIFPTRKCFSIYKIYIPIYYPKTSFPP